MLVFAASFAQAATGIGFGVIAGPFFIHAYGYVRAVVETALFSLAVAAVCSAKSLRWVEPRFAVMLTVMLPVGLAIGAALACLVAQSVIVAAFALLLCVLSATLLWQEMAGRHAAAEEGASPSGRLKDYAPMACVAAIAAFLFAAPGGRSRHAALRVPTSRRAPSASSINTLYVAYGVGVRFGGGMMYVPSVGVMQRWFKRHRGLASGLAICGTGVGTLVVPFLTTMMITGFGWRTTHYVLALGVLAICGAASLVLVASPGLLGLAPDGDPHPAEDKGHPLPGLTLAQALSTPAFWLLYFASLVSSGSVFITYVHLVPNALDNGLSAQGSIILVGALGNAGTFGRFLLGDRRSCRPAPRSGVDVRRPHGSDGMVVGGAADVPLVDDLCRGVRRVLWRHRHLDSVEAQSTRNVRDIDPG